ncbi:MAG: SH3 domain-containing protein [Tabrizicola sp.]|jgi:uncharacterized membrane protein|nr:SH3 domain-containing protein [Tabrizicola sp.]
MIRGALFCLLASGSAMAQDLPAAFRVTGVGAEDVLNIRQAPNAASEKIGEIGPYGVNIEVLALSENGRWGKIGMPEGNGWIAMRYLAPQELTADEGIPRPISCLGAEPFWRLGLYPGGDEFERMGEERVDLRPKSEKPGEDGWQASFGTRDSATYGLVVVRGLCGDGMSDREFGWRATMYIDKADGSDTLQGCCTLDHRAAP